MSERHLVAQVAFGLNPVVRGPFAHDHQQIVGHRVAKVRTADKLPEQQNIFRIENATCQVFDDLFRFFGIVQWLRRFGDVASGIFLMKSSTTSKNPQ